MSLFEWVLEKFGFVEEPEGKFYVYELKDPRFEDHRTFYVGKGTGDRVYQHQQEALRLQRKGLFMRLKPKHKRILEIIRDGYQVEFSIAFRTDDEWQAYMVESARIDHYGLDTLTNETYGYRPKSARTTVTVVMAGTATRATKSRRA